MAPQDVVDEATLQRALDAIGGLGQHVAHQPPVTQTLPALGFGPQSGNCCLAPPQGRGKESCHGVGAAVGKQVDDGCFVCRPPGPQLDDPRGVRVRHDHASLRPGPSPTRHDDVDGFGR